MSSLESDLMQPERQGDDPAPPPADAAPPPTEDAAPLNVEDDAAVDAALAANEIAVPDGDALVPKSEAGKIAHGYREKIRNLKAEVESAKAGSLKAQQLEQQVAQLQAQLQQLTPIAQAYQAALTAQPQTEDPQERAELEEIARDLDFYKADGQLDLDRAKRVQTRENKRAERIAQQAVAPLQNATVQQRSEYNLARAKNTQINGVKVDPAILDELWARLPANVTADEQGAKELLISALGRAALKGAMQPAPEGQTRGADGTFIPREAPPPPIYREKAGGRDTPGDSPALSQQERDFIAHAGMTEAEYLKTAGNMPGGRR